MAIAGREGHVVWAGKLPASYPIREWNADITVDTFDTTTMAATPPRGRSRISGLQDATGTISFVAATGAAGELPGTPSVRLQLKADSNVIYEFDAILSGIHPSVVVDGENLLVYDFEMDDSNGVYITGEPTGSPASSPH
jgi:hypothetical protein